MNSVRGDIIHSDNATLAKFVTADMSHVVWQPFGAIPSSSDMFCTLNVVLRRRLSRLRS